MGRGRPLPRPSPAQRGHALRLLWAHHLTLPYDASLPLLDRLFADDIRYVTRSVANHINGISQTDVELALDPLERWRNTGLQHPREMNYVIRHGARTLRARTTLALRTSLDQREASELNSPAPPRRWPAPGGRPLRVGAGSGRAPKESNDVGVPLG